eukprot:174776-Pelagomonas_calceolata.AAC.2
MGVPVEHSSTSGLTYENPGRNSFRCTTDRKISACQLPSLEGLGSVRGGEKKGLLDLKKENGNTLETALDGGHLCNARKGRTGAWAI